MNGRRAQSLGMSSDEAIDLGVLPSLLGYQLRRAQILVFQTFARHLREYEITPTQFAVLVLIEANAGLSQRALSAAVGTDQSSLVSLLDRLQLRGWVARQRSRRDRRFHVLSLTEQGRKYLREMKARVVRQDQELSGHLSAGERDALTDLLRRLLCDPPD